MEKRGKQGSRKRKAPMPEEDEKQNEIILEEVLSISGKNAEISVEKDEESPDESKVPENKTKEKVVTPKKGKAKKSPVSSPAPSPSKQKKSTDKKKANTPKEVKASASEKGDPAPNLPDGWRKEITVRKSGKTIGQTDVYFYTPEGKKLRSRPEVISHIKRNNLKIKIEDFDFSKKVSKNAKADEKKKSKETPQGKKGKNQLEVDKVESEEPAKPIAKSPRKNNKIQQNEKINKVESRNRGTNSVSRKRTKIQPEEKEEIKASSKATPKKSRAGKSTKVPPSADVEENVNDEDNSKKVVVKILDSKPKKIRK